MTDGPTPAAPAGEDWARLSLERVLAHLDAQPGGLTAAEASRRLRRYGPNTAGAVARVALVWRFLLRFRNPLVVILLIASALSAATGDIASLVLVMGVVTLSITLDFVQEVRAESAVDALRRSVAVRATVLRDGALISLPVEQLVPGDVCELIAGDLVPADARLIAARDLFVNQALMTGEPYPVAKAMTGLGDAVFAGTSVISGTARIVLIRTGADTALGALAASLALRPPDTAFTVGVAHFGLLITRFTVLMVLFVLVVNIWYDRPVLESLMFALALAVGLTPELLPMIVTVTLSHAAMQLGRRHIIVKRLSAIHDLGAMDMFCTDKTGTLTEATITLVRCIDGLGAESDRAHTLAAVNSAFESGMKSPLDAAILAARPVDLTGWVKIDEVPFDFERRRVSVLVEHEGARLLVVKGAPEDLLRLSRRWQAADGSEAVLEAASRAAFDATLADLGAQGFRALGVAVRVDPGQDDAAEAADEADLVFVGFAVFIDPPKASAGATVQQLGRMGIAVKVLTGDTEAVSRHVFGEIGIPVTGVLTGAQLSAMSDEALIGQLPQVNLFARVNPQEKHRVLLALKRMGHVVGFMGDGINDAPALHAADVGISVEGAADVARAAADLILLQPDLSVLSQAVTAGRGAVQNVSKYVLMGSSSNFGNMFSMAGAALFLPFLPMLPIQILLNNLLYDLSEIAIPFDAVDPEAVARPVTWDIRLVERFMLVFGPVSSLFDFLTFYALIAVFGAGEALFHTGWFVVSMTTQVLVVFAIRTRRVLWQSRPHRAVIWCALAVVMVAVVLPLTPPGVWFGFVAPPPLFWAYLVVTTTAYLALVELTKSVFFARRGAGGGAKAAQR